MRTHVALLRGINVGGHNPLAMADLRDVMVSLGHTDVATYIQSGNVVFMSSVKNAVSLAGSIEEGIAGALGVRPRVVVLTRAELLQVIADNPFPDETNSKAVHAIFRQTAMKSEEVDAVAAALQRARAKGSPDDARTVGRILFLHTPDGLGRSELAAQLARAKGPLAKDAPATVRNWATVTKLRSMLGG